MHHALMTDKELGNTGSDSNLRRAVSILGVPLGYGASMAGVDMGPAALRVAGLYQRISKLGLSVRDLGDLRLERAHTDPKPDEKLKYLRQISSTCEELDRQGEEI